MLGDSEPIGAHVDPYDPTSPVRISPEEQGDEQEVLDEYDVNGQGQFNRLSIDSSYVEAESGEGLATVGGKKWIKAKEEDTMVQRFEKFTMLKYPVMPYSCVVLVPWPASSWVFEFFTY